MKRNYFLQIFISESRVSSQMLCTVLNLGFEFEGRGGSKVETIIYVTVAEYNGCYFNMVAHTKKEKMKLFHSATVIKC